VKILRVATAPEVLVATDELAAALARGPAHPGDALAAQGLPAWRARELLGARALLRSLLAEVEPGAHSAALATEAAGRPLLPEWPGLCVSLSHDGGTVAAAVGRCRRVGVDVQTPPAWVTEAMIRRCLRQQASSLQRLDEAGRGVELAWVWTVQEACVKAQGTGIAGRPWTIDVPPGRSSGRWGRYAWTALRAHSTIPLSCAYSLQHACAEAVRR